MREGEPEKGRGKREGERTPKPCPPCGIPITPPGLPGPPGSKFGVSGINISSSLVVPLTLFLPLGDGSSILPPTLFAFTVGFGKPPVCAGEPC
jgi:hypothetical protein